MRGRPRGQVGLPLLGYGVPYPIAIPGSTVNGGQESGYYGPGPGPMLGRRRGYRPLQRFAWGQAAGSANGAPVSTVVSNLQPGDLVMATYMPSFTFTFSGSTLLSGTDRIYHKWITTESSVTVSLDAGAASATVIAVVVRGADAAVPLKVGAWNVGVTPDDPRSAVFMMARGNLSNFTNTLPSIDSANGGFAHLARVWGETNMYNQRPKLAAAWNPRQGMRATGTGLIANDGIGGGNFIAVAMLK